MEKPFRCECNKAFQTARDFSDHVHTCSVNPVPWEPSGDYLAARKSEEEKALAARAA
jgi:hypothetical protein